MASPMLGWIEPADRTKAQEAAHGAAVAAMPKFALPGFVEPPKGTKVLLTDAWKAPDVVADVGFVFPRFHQITGSCVGAGGGQALFTLCAVQRLFATNPTKAFIPWWPHPYGKSRLLMGDHSQGEGSLGSTFAQAVKKYGVMAATESGLPKFSTEDGLTLTRSQELQWSDGDSSTVMQYDATAVQHLLGAAAEVKDVADLRAGLVNGYPASFACNLYIGNGRVQGSGDNAVVLGKWDGRGGHQQSVHGFWDHPDQGPLYLALNNWPGSTYPILPTQPVCSTWVKEADVTAAMRQDGEVYLFSSLPWFPAVAAVIDWSAL